VPDAFTPSNELWADLIRQRAFVTLTLARARIAGNVTGVLVREEKHAELLAAYGEATFERIVDEAAAGRLALGYTYPFASSSGLNFVVSVLAGADAANPLSPRAVARFEALSQSSPLVAYTTIQMRAAATLPGNALDAMVMEYQSYVNTPELSGYRFVPFGARHDSPVYAVGSLTAEKAQTLEAFCDFCLSGDAQRAADAYGFNGMDGYEGALPELGAGAVSRMQALWKELKDTGRAVTAVFVADVSASMAGEPLDRLKESLASGARYINERSRVGLISFSTDVYLNLPVAEFGQEQRELFGGAVGALSAGGASAAYDAILVGLDMIRQSLREDPASKPLLVVLSDGASNAGNDLGGILEIAEGFGVPIYTVGYNAQLAELKSISDINAAVSVNADAEDVAYTLRNLLNAQL